MKRYKWTISVIVIYNKDEKPLVEAYKEFEEAIESQPNPNKDIRFLIFFYDSSDKIVIIKEAILYWNRLKLVDKEMEKEADIYEKDHKLLKHFFSKYVVYKPEVKNDDVEHRHMLILWGHGVGLGFIKEEIKKNIYSVLPKNNNNSLSLNHIESAADEILKVNKLTAFLSLKRNPPLYDSIKNRILKILSPAGLSKHGKNMEEMFDATGIENMVDKQFRVITARDLAGIIQVGLEGDMSVYTVGSKVIKPQTARIHTMICLTCYVNMVETEFALKDVVSIYIAPQTEIPFYGYNYYKLFELLAIKPQVNEIEISRNITHNYLVKYLDKKITGELNDNILLHGLNYKDGISFSCIYLDSLEPIADIIRLFSTFIYNVLTTNSSSESIGAALEKARKTCLPLAIGSGADIGIIDYENFIAEFFQTYRFSEDADKFFTNGGYKISDYTPALLCRSKYDPSLGRFLSVSPGSFSIFLPDPTISSTERELMELYFESSDDFLLKTNWKIIMQLINPPVTAAV